MAKEMTFGEKLKKARSNAGVKQSELAEKLNTTGNTVSNWENDVSKPDLEKLSYICGILHVSASYFLEPKMPEDVVSFSELQMVKKYRLLDDFGRETVDIALNRETQRMEQIKQQTNLVEFSSAELRAINYYYRLASAGTGQILFDMPPSQKIEIPNIPEYKKVDYAIGVNGNSMEPEFLDGDILLIEMSEQIAVGEIGIFVVNGESYVKKLGNGELISLNPDYANIPLNENAKCMGKVIDKYKE